MASETHELHPPGHRSLVGAGEILRALVRKELKVKYKRSVLGFVWSLVTPLALAAVYLFVFVYVYPIQKEGFSLFLLSGLFPWHYFNMAVTAATNSFVDNAPLIRKVYFPRLLVPLSTVGANLVNFLLALVLLCAIVAFSGRPFWLMLHWLVFAVALETALCIGASLALSVWNVYLRDIRQLIAILMLILFFATPIVYDLDDVTGAFRPLILANPMTAVMEAYHAALFHVSTPDLGVIALGVLETLLVGLIGYAVFRRHESKLAKEL